jgi:hypothetical protein
MVPDPAPAIALAPMRKLSVGPETGMPLMMAVGAIELLTLSTLLEPEKLMSERPIEAEEPPETLSKRPLRMLRLLPSARLTRLPAMLSTLPPATLTRWPGATIGALRAGQPPRFSPVRYRPSRTLTSRPARRGR